MIYRDSVTGKFVSKATWKRSKAQGGTRYVRQSPAVGRGERRKEGARTPRRAPQVFEYIISFSYTKTGRSIDVISTGKTQEQAVEAAHDLLSKDSRAKAIVESGFKGWDEVVAKGNKTGRIRKAHFRSGREEGEEDED